MNSIFGRVSSAKKGLRKRLKVDEHGAKSDQAKPRLVLMFVIGAALAVFFFGQYADDDLPLKQIYKDFPIWVSGNFEGYGMSYVTGSTILIVSTLLTNRGEQTELLILACWAVITLYLMFKKTGGTGIGNCNTSMLTKMALAYMAFITGINLARDVSHGLGDIEPFYKHHIMFSIVMVASFGTALLYDFMQQDKKKIQETADAAAKAAADAADTGDK